MKTSAFLSVFALSLLAVVPANANESEYTYDEFETNIPQAPEEKSPWTFSCGIEAVYGHSLTDGYEQQFGPNGEKSGKRDLKLGGAGGVNARMSWISSEEAFKGTSLCPEIYLLAGTMLCTAHSDGANISLTQGAVGGNLHYPLPAYRNVSVFGGARIGVGFLANSSEGENDTALTYGVGGGINFKLGKRGNTLRLGADYLATTASSESETGGFSVSEPKWITVSLGLNVSF